jgi:hypothetical protein
MIFRKYGFTSSLEFEIHSVIHEFEEKYEIRLSDEAKMMMILPLSELSYRSPKRRIREDWVSSLEKLLFTIKDEPAFADKEANEMTYNLYRRNERTSQSVIKAFANRFCKIPPFCGER